MEKFKFKKKFGQNFLQDENILRKINECVDVKTDDLIIEIGPGHGALTKYLKNKGAQVICYEIDLDTKDVLLPLEDAKTKIIFQDFLDVNLIDDLKAYSYNNLYIIANLPYYITTPIIQKIIDSKIDPKTMILMVQKEVAERFNAKPKSKAYNSLTVYLNYYFDIKTEFIVGRNSFYPIPNVDSAIIRFDAKCEKLKLNNMEDFNKILRESFKQKRKTLRNNLGTEIFNEIFPILASHGHLEMVRAEEISLEEFVEIANYLK